MLPSVSDLLVRSPVALAAALAAGLALPAGAQQEGDAASEEGAVQVVATQMSISDDEAELTLELSDGGALSITLGAGRVWLDGRRVAEYESGGALERSWRRLLRELSGSPGQVAAELLAWDAPAEDVGRLIDEAVTAALRGAPPGARAATPAAAVQQGPTGASQARDAMAGVGDSVVRLQERIQELERTVTQLERRRASARAPARSDRRSGWLSGPFRHIWNGISGLVSTLAVYAVLVGIGFVTVFFGRQYLEAVADTARHATVRSWAVGFAASFLVLPAYITGLLVLVISVVGIPALIVWIPLFPVAVLLALLFGYLGVGHAAGEALAERRFYGGEWFRRANSYYYILTGIGLLLALFFASHVVQMGGPLLGFVRGLLTFLGVTLTWAAFTIGLGAVLLSRAGSRPIAGAGRGREGVLDEEEARV